MNRSINHSSHLGTTSIRWLGIRAPVTWCRCHVIPLPGELTPSLRSLARGGGLPRRRHVHDSLRPSWLRRARPKNPVTDSGNIQVTCLHCSYNWSLSRYGKHRSNRTNKRKFCRTVQFYKSLTEDVKSFSLKTTRGKFRLAEKENCNAFAYPRLLGSHSQSSSSSNGFFSSG